MEPQDRRGGAEAHLRGVVHLYPTPDGDVVALRGVDLDVGAGEWVALLGPSGAGKSTVLALLAGSFAPSAGSVTVDGRELGRLSGAELRRLRCGEIALVTQGATSNLLPYATIAENVWFACRGARRLPRRMAVGEAVELLGLGDLADVPVHALSAGEAQRAALATGVALRPRLLLVDEPTSQLDAGGRGEVIGALARVHDQLGTTMVIVTHEAEVAGRAPRTVTIRDGRVGAEGRFGVDFAVVGRDGSLQLPPEALELLRPDSLVHVLLRPGHVELRPSVPPGSPAAPDGGP